MQKELGTEIELVVNHTIHGDFCNFLFGDTLQFMREITLDKPTIDLLLREMDWEIFADFRKTLDLKGIADSLPVVFAT